MESSFERISKGIALLGGWLIVAWFNVFGLIYRFDKYEWGWFIFHAIAIIGTGIAFNGACKALFAVKAKS